MDLQIKVKGEKPTKGLHVIIPIDGVFEINGEQLKCQSRGGRVCTGCAFHGYDALCDVFECTHNCRYDRKEVYFIRIENEETSNQLQSD